MNSAHRQLPVLLDSATYFKAEINFNPAKAADKVCNNYGVGHFIAVHDASMSVLRRNSAYFQVLANC